MREKYPFPRDETVHNAVSFKNLTPLRPRNPQTFPILTVGHRKCHDKLDEAIRLREAATGVRSKVYLDHRVVQPQQQTAEEVRKERINKWL